MDRPIVCTLDATDLAGREGVWQELLRSGLVQRERVPGGIRLSAQPDAVGVLLQLVALERECCAWIDYEVGESSVTLTAEGGGEQVLAGMFLLRP